MARTTSLYALTALNYKLQNCVLLDISEIYYQDGFNNEEVEVGLVGIRCRTFPI